MTLKITIPAIQDLPRVEIGYVPLEALSLMLEWLDETYTTEANWWATLKYIYFKDPEMATVFRLKFGL